MSPPVGSSNRLAIMQLSLSKIWKQCDRSAWALMPLRLANSTVGWQQAGTSAAAAAAAMHVCRCGPSLTACANEPNLLL